MKICRNELLLLGGMYQLFAFIVAMFNNQIAYAMGGVLYVLFWVAVLALSMSFIASWGFVHRMNENFPRLSVFLVSIGWIPYFSVIYAIISLIVLSLLYAAYKVFYKGEDLAMSCYNYGSTAR